MLGEPPRQRGIIMSSEYAVIDFETTGFNEDDCRVIEVAAVIVQDGQITDSFVQLMHPGCWIPFFITELTGISNSMVKRMPRPEEVMPKLMDFIGDLFCIAHNANFDSRFYHAEMRRAGIAHERSFFCTVLLSRRLIQDSPNHQLGTLAHHLNLPMPAEGSYHRALYDVLLTVELWKHIEGIISERLGDRIPDHDVYLTLMRTPRAAAWRYLDKLAMKGEE